MQSSYPARTPVNSSRLISHALARGTDHNPSPPIYLARERRCPRIYPIPTQSHRRTALARPPLRRHDLERVVRRR